MKNASRCVLTIGKFEGLHRGHQHLIGETVRLAQKQGLRSVVVTFEPHPRQVLGDGYAPLFTQSERADILKRLQVDTFSAYHFDRAFVNQTPTDFCARLFNEFDIEALVLGEGFRFGKGRAGSVQTITQAAAARGIHTQIAQHIQHAAGKISTSQIRAQLSNGLPQEAYALLGFSFFINGVVCQGKQLGKQLDYPTLNLVPAPDKFLPKEGVYKTQVRVGESVYKGVTNVGTRPSFDDGTHPTVETFLLDYNQSLYGEAICIEFLQFIRPELKFDSPHALKRQIANDVAAAWDVI
jgi:riboflavin kinase/FMN adenylyltransferase